MIPGSGPSALSHRAAVFLALFVTVLWSSSWVLIRFGFEDHGLRPLGFAGLRYGFAALVLLAVAAARGDARTALRTLGPADWRRLLLLGTVMIAVTQGAQFVAIAHQPAATTSLLLSMTPLLVASASAASLGEPPTRRQVLGALAILLGAGVYFGGQLGFTRIGMTAAVVGLVANSAAALLGRAVNRTAAIPALVVTAVSMAAGSLLLLGAAVAVEEMPRPGPGAWVIITWLAVVNTALAFTLWNASLRRLSATESAGLNNTMLIQIALLAWWFLGEVPGTAEWVGITLVAAGVFVVQLRPRRVAAAPVVVTVDPDPG